MSKVQFGKITSPTPSWAKWMFRITAMATTVIAFYVAGSSLILPQYKTEVLLLLKSIDMLVLGFSKLFGIVDETPGKE